jgi:hypothetical protein
MYHIKSLLQQRHSYVRVIFTLLFLTLALCASSDINTTQLNHSTAASIVENNAIESNSTESFKNTSLKEGKTDIVVIRDSRLEGQVVGLTSESLRFELIYGRGSILISFADIDELHTQHSYHIFYNGKESIGKIIGIENHKWLIVKEGSSTELIEIHTIDRFVLSTEEDSSATNYFRNLFPYISGNIDVALELEDNSPSTTEIDIATRLEYQRKRDRVIVQGEYQYDTKTMDGQPTQTTKDEYAISAQYNHYNSAHKDEFSFLTGGVEHDGLRHIDHRYYGALGLGHRFNHDPKRYFELQGGLGGVYNEYDNYPIESYAALYGGFDFLYTFSNGLLWRGNMLYMPSVGYGRQTWLFRANTSLTIPLSQMLALKFSITEVDDDNPTPDIGNNKITTDFGMSLLF